MNTVCKDCIFPDLSIIIPVYNGEMFIENTVEKIIIEADRTTYNIEIILVNDGSKDNSQKICQNLTERSRDKCIIRLINQVNMGISKARNSAIAVCLGKYIGFCDQDDEILHGFISDNLNIAMKNDADAVKFNAKVTCQSTDNKSREIIFHKIKTSEIIRCIEDKHSAFKKYSESANFVWNGFYKAEIIKNNKIEFNGDIKSGGEDFEFCYRIFPYLNCIAINSGTFYHHIIREKISVSSNLSLDRIDTSILICKSLKNAFNMCGLDINSRLCFEIICIQIRKNARILLDSHCNVNKFEKFKSSSTMILGDVKYKKKDNQSDKYSIYQIIEYFLLTHRFFYTFYFLIAVFQFLGR